MGTRKTYMFAEEIEQSLLEEHTTSDESSSSDEIDSCESDDLTVGEVNFAECSENERCICVGGHDKLCRAKGTICR
jgi:hypothetical protein